MLDDYESLYHAKRDIIHANKPSHNLNASRLFRPISYTVGSKIVLCHEVYRERVRLTPTYFITTFDSVVFAYQTG